MQTTHCKPSPPFRFQLVGGLRPCNPLRHDARLSGPQHVDCGHAQITALGRMGLAASEKLRHLDAPNSFPWLAGLTVGLHVSSAE